MKSNLPNLATLGLAICCRCWFLLDEIRTCWMFVGHNEVNVADLMIKLSVCLIKSLALYVSNWKLQGKILCGKRLEQILIELRNNFTWWIQVSRFADDSFYTSEFVLVVMYELVRAYSIGDKFFLENIAIILQLLTHFYFQLSAPFSFKLFRASKEVFVASRHLWKWSQS